AKLLTGILALGTILGACALITMFASPPGVVLWLFDSGTQLPTFGPFVYRNQYAAFIEVVLPLATLRVLDSSERLARWSYLAVAALLLGSVVGAGSRTGTVLCLAEIFFFIPLIVWRRGWISLGSVAGALATVAAAAASGVLMVGWQTIWARLQEPNPYSFRADLLRSSLEMVRAHPWTGFGLGSWSAVYPGFAFFDDGRFVNQAHSDWAQWAVEGGILLFLLMLVVVSRIAPAACRSVWGFGIIAVFLHCLVDYPMQQRPALTAFFFAIAGAVMASSQVTRTSVAQESLGQ
ncbi:MAG: O-antigen ligase family protein, partial [Acidobacteriota bacterium]